MSPQVERAARAVIGAAIEVHRHLGPAFVESVYEHSLAKEMDLREISFRRQAAWVLEYKGAAVGEGRLDFLVDGCLVVEIKAVTELLPIHLAQTISYLRSTRHRLALLINFNVRILKDGIHRVVF
jgi:GxxExxY protein